MYHNLSRLIQVSFLASFLAYYAVNTEYSRVSRELGAETQWRTTYVTTNDQGLYGKPQLKYSQPLDTTAVILNWSRLSNVVQLVKVMCSSPQDTIAHVFVWNNNPQPLTFEDFAQARCPSHMLRIYNSPENVYFQARFLACARADTRYCFIQDDDYFIQTSIIRAMRMRMAEIQNTSIHLLPPHEMLYSRSSTIKAGPVVHTSFAWLGYGAMVERSDVRNFLDLLRTINATDDVFKMADNYFTILSNRLPELWFDQNHELGGGTPFTVGAVGEERNNKHIMNAGLMLDSLVHGFSQSPASSFPYVSLPAPLSLGAPAFQAACIWFPCIMETNIKLLPNLLNETASSASEFISHVTGQLEALGNDAMERYVQFSPSFAVDANATTSFQSVDDAMEGDWIALDWMNGDFGTEEIEFALLIDPSTEIILTNSRFESSGDGKIWHKLLGEVTCSVAEGDTLLECSVALDKIYSRKIRVLLERRVPCGWVVHEMWLRERRSS